LRSSKVLQYRLELPPRAARVSRRSVEKGPTIACRTSSSAKIVLNGISARNGIERHVLGDTRVAGNDR
jgi:hypothetical protein